MPGTREQMSRLSVRVTPKSGKDEIGSLVDGVLQVRVAAPPDEGRANAAVCMLVARALGVPKSSVRVLKGTTARLKVLAVEGMAQTEADKILGG